MQDEAAQTAEAAQAQVDRVQHEFMAYQQSKAAELAALDETVRKLIQGGASLDAGPASAKKSASAAQGKKAPGSLQVRKKGKGAVTKKQAGRSPVKAAPVAAEPVHVPCCTTAVRVRQRPGCMPVWAY